MIAYSCVVRTLLDPPLQKKNTRVNYINEAGTSPAGGRGAMPPPIFVFAPPIFFLPPTVFFWVEEVGCF